MEERPKRGYQHHNLGDVKQWGTLLEVRDIIDLKAMAAEDKKTVSQFCQWLIRRDRRRRLKKDQEAKTILI